MVFLGDSAFYLAAIVFGFGSVLIFYSCKENSRLLKTSGYILSVVGILGALCTGYYWLKYYSNGHFDKPYPPHAMKMHLMDKGMKGGMGMMGGKGMMMGQMQNCMNHAQGKMMNPEMMKEMKSCMMGGSNGTPKADGEDHEAHH